MSYCCLPVLENKYHNDICCLSLIIIDLIRIMGCGSSINIQSDENLKQHVFEIRLKNGIFYKYLSNYAQAIYMHFIIVIWECVEKYMASSWESPDTLSSLQLLLVHRQEYFPMAEEFIKLCKDIEDNYENCRIQQRHVLILQIQKLSLKHMYSQIYLPFTKTPEYVAACAYVDHPFTAVGYESFEYLNVLASGGFGVVLQCRKISNGKMYAMKIQPKIALLRQYRHDKDRVSRELAANVVLHHPYIASISFAFQTKTLTMLVSPISGCGDLQRSLRLCPNSRMSLDRVVFYSAEIASALMYLHSHDIMYRDLKPSNVLLNSDGHIMLADLGSLTGTNLMDAVIHMRIVLYMDICM